MPERGFPAHQPKSRATVRCRQAGAGAVEPMEKGRARNPQVPARPSGGPDQALTRRRSASLCCQSGRLHHRKPAQGRHRRYRGYLKVCSLNRAKVDEARTCSRCLPEPRCRIVERTIGVRGDVVGPLPQVVAGQADMRPAHRRDMDEQRLGNGLASAAKMIDGAF